ncbi:hypothetical protein LOAG_03534 [Loa loa]|uniref:Uncharacterized protein n=2 Tax=Loa loa TaxID=7209 RepID=A0A1S0U4H7_LOALO|nr:hypothetical protein LOAG_03534 [Loa loa]EFO24951.1 hypothetical protein LOAG_03534 [Loa loa]
MKRRGDVNATANVRKNGQLPLVSVPFILTDKFQPIILRNKLGQSQFVRPRKLIGKTSSEGMKKILDQERTRFQLQWFNFRHRPFNFSNQLPMIMKIDATSHLLSLTTTGSPIAPLLQNKNNFDLESRDLKLFGRNKFRSKFLQEVPLTTVDIFGVKSSTPRTMALEQQSQQETQHVIFQNVEQTSASQFFELKILIKVTGSVLPTTITVVEVHTSPPFTVQSSLPVAQLVPSLSQSLSSSAAPPGFSPPNDEVVAQLNDAQNFHALAELMQLRRHFSRNGTN